MYTQALDIPDAAEANANTAKPMRAPSAGDTAHQTRWHMAAVVARGHQDRRDGEFDFQA